MLHDAEVVQVYGLILIPSKLDERNDVHWVLLRIVVLPTRSSYWSAKREPIRTYDGNVENSMTASIFPFQSITSYPSFKVGTVVRYGDFPNSDADDSFLRSEGM